MLSAGSARKRHLTNKEALTVLCSVVKNAGSYYFLSALPLLKCLTTEQSTLVASLFLYYETTAVNPKLGFS